jgi:hypothetical protein
VRQPQLGEQLGEGHRVILLTGHPPIFDVDTGCVNLLQPGLLVSPPGARVPRRRGRAAVGDPARYPGRSGVHRYTSLFQFCGYFGLFCATVLILRALVAVLRDRIN